MVNNDWLLVSLLAVVVGGLTGCGIIVFREGIVLLEGLSYGGDIHYLASTVALLPWWAVMLPPVLGGLVVGLWHRLTMPTGRPENVSHVVEAAVLRGGRMPVRRGLASAVGAMLSLGFGASVGREGPAVHLGATLGAWLARTFHFGRGVSRTLLGCGAAAAVAASFNAPIAGALFAHEVVVGHYAASAFAPVVMSSLAGTIVSRLWFGAEPAFALTLGLNLTSFFGFPVFIILGVVCGLVAAVFMTSLVLTDWATRRSGVPPWLRPAIAGLGLGGIAMAYPEVLGVGYEVTTQSLAGGLSFDQAVPIAAAKIVATVLCLGFGFGGGVFSPSLTIGAVIGAAVGALATAAAPAALSSGPGAYALVGMGAMAAAVLGAPISTCLIVFEMTANYPLTLGVMAAVVVATVVSQGLTGHRSLFHWQLSRRGLDVDRDRERQMMREIRVQSVVTPNPPTVPPDAGTAAIAAAFRDHGGEKLFVVDGAGRLLGSIALPDVMAVLMERAPETHPTAMDLALTEPPALALLETLSEAIDAIEASGESQMAVVRDRATMRLVGVVHERDLMRTYAGTLGRLRAEERGDPDH
ncbi:chloride channel protein [Roseospira marina]|uniref:chloride channel protein n=1 Tax=Roseospira marina TaxID=140057 RepID=UPI00183D5FE6|nr:chloride channel protein [Roseospira marina]MBB4313589.1 CIC family chloride channel protein [Roseospira marina]MBB5086751.1 CIC family chloride channel protein [Roseospira marina]